MQQIIRGFLQREAEQVSYTYDKHDVVTSVTDALGNVTLYTVNANGQVEEKILPNGGSYRYAYDEVHRLTGITTPLGYETAFTYSAGNDILKQEDSLGRTTLYEYDVLHNLTKVTDPEGGITGYTYDVRSNLESATNALGHTWSYAYDKVDRMTTVTDPEEKAASIVYDRVGNIEAITAPGGRTIRYGYDNNYNIVSLTDPMGYVYGYTYDRDDRLTGTTDPLGQTTAYRYDSVNRPVSYTDKMGLTESYAYDAHGNLLSYTAADGLVTQYAYDLMNRLTSVTDPMGSTAYYSWDSMGNLTAVTDYLGRGTSYTYDLENNLTSITGPTGRQEVMTYDAASRITAYVSNSGNRIRYDYDKLDGLVEKAYTDAAGKESAQPVEYTYDALGQRLTMEDSTGDTVYTYDSLGRLTAVITYRRPEREDGGNSTGGSGSAGNTGSSAAGDNGNTDYSHEEGRGDTIGYTYDEADNLSAITYPDGTKVSYEYDLNGSLVKVTGRRGEETVYEYDALNRPVAEHRPNGISTYKVYNARNQITELTNRCDDCGWVLEHYVYTYDDRGYIVAEHAEEAREMDPYGRERYTPYAPEKQGENCDHGKNKALAYRLLTTDSTFTYDDAGKLLAAAETEAGCSAMTVWTYSYDLMGNLSEKAQYKAENFTEISKMDAVSSEKYVYNENNQLAEAVICDGKTTRKVQYTYDADGNLIQEYSPTDRSLTTYSYTVENRLEAVYTGNAYNKTLQMAAAYDGDGNRVYQLNYNPDKDEDFSDYYCSDNNCDYNGTGIQLLAEKEISQAEKDLMALIGDSGAVRNSQYELIEYLNDVNREYAEVLVEQNINGRVDTAYTYGNERISWEMFNQTSRTAYYLYDPRGSVSGLTDGSGHLTKTYRYSANGELTFGGAKYENEYTYNSESYNPNIQSQYLRARYYSVIHASFLTEDSYLGNIVQPLTLNRYNYCVSSWLNYRDPSGNYFQDVIDFFGGAQRFILKSFVLATISTMSVPSYLYEVERNKPTPRETLQKAKGGVAKWAGGIKRDLYNSYIEALNDFAARGETQSKIAFGTYIAHGIAWQNLEAFCSGFEQGAGDYPTYLEYNSARADLQYSVHAGCYTANLVKTASGIVQVVGGVILTVDGLFNTVASPGTGPAMGLVGTVAIGEVALGYGVTGNGARTLTQSIPAVLEEVGAMYSVHKVNVDRMLGNESGTGSKFRDVFDLADNYNLSDDTFNNHILDRHGPNSTYGNKSHFNTDFDIRDGIDSTLRGENFVVGPNTAGREGYIFEQTFTKPIGTSSKGKPLYTLKVVIDEAGNVITAFPKK